MRLRLIQKNEPCDERTEKSDSRLRSKRKPGEKRDERQPKNEPKSSHKLKKLTKTPDRASGELRNLTTSQHLTRPTFNQPHITANWRD